MLQKTWNFHYISIILHMLMISITRIYINWKYLIFFSIQFLIFNEYFWILNTTLLICSNNYTKKISKIVSQYFIYFYKRLIKFFYNYYKIERFYKYFQIKICLKFFWFVQFDSNKQRKQYVLNFLVKMFHCSNNIF